MKSPGLTAPQWIRLCEALGQEEALRRIIQEPGWQVAAAILGLWQEEPLKTGNCLDPDEEAACQQLEVWLQAWKANPERPREMLDLLHTQAHEGPIQEPTLWPDAGDTRVGGRSAKDPEDRKLVTPVLLGEERDRFFASVGLPGENLLNQLDQTGQEAVLSKLADSTRRSYGTGWKQWATFMSGTGVSPFLQGETRTEKQADGEWLIRFVVFLHQHMGRTAQGIKQRLSGIRYAHIAAGYPDPLAGRVRLWAALAGMHRWDGAPVRKVPVTPRMLTWLRVYLQGSNRPAEEKAAVWASICLGWFYMLRASEYLPGIDALNAPSRVLRGSDLDFFRDGKKCQVSEADSLAVQLRDSKGDQFGRGQVRLQHATGDDICPVRALQEHAKLNPHWLQDSGLPVCAWQGVGISREGVSEALRLAAVALGYPAHLVASHSLRKGGATAMLAITSDVETVKRFGGWKSDAVHAYLYTDMAAAPNRAKEMLTSKPVLQPQQHAQAPNRVGGNRSLDHEQHYDTRCGGPEDPRPEDEEFGDSDDPDWLSVRAKLRELERETGLTWVQRVRLKKQIAKGGVVEPPVFLQRFGGIPEWFAPVSAANSSTDAGSAPSLCHAAIPVPPVQASADELSTLPQLFLPEQVFHSPSWRSALPHAVMADNAPRPAGMGHAQLRDWINQWGSAWAFLGLEPGSSMTDVMKAFKKKALVLHPDKVPESEKADATLRMSALGNAKEILLSPGLRILHDNLLGLGGTAPPPAPGAPPPSSSAAPPQPEPEPSSRPGPSSSSSSKAPPPGPSSSSSWYNRPGQSSSSSSKAPPPDPFSGYDYTWFEKGKGKGPWRQKGRNVWEDPYGTVWEEMSGSSEFYDEEGFESDDSWELDSDSSGPQIDRYPRVRKGRVLRFCRQCGHHQYWGEGWCFGCGWVRSHRRWRTERFPGFGKGGKGKGKGASGTHRGKGSKSSGSWRDRPGAEPSGARASADPPPTESKKAPPPPPPSGDGGPKARAPPPREGFFDTWWCYNCKAKVSTHALKCPTCNRQRGDNRSWRNAGTNRPEYKAPPKARPSSPPPSTAPNASQAPPPRPTKAPPAGAHRPSAAGPPPFKAAPKPPPAAAFSNTLHWVCGTCGEVNGLHRYGCNTCSASQHAEGNIHEHATHWICPHCQDEVSVKRTVCDCGKWRPRSAPLINHGQAAEDRFVAKGAAAAPVVLNRREVVNQGAGLGLEEPPTEGSHPAPTLDQVSMAGTHEEVVEVEDDEMGVTPQDTDDMVVPTHADVAAMDVDEPELVSTYTPPTTKTPGIPAKAYPGQTVWRPPQSSQSMMSTTSRPISYSPGDFTAEPAPEPENEGSPGAGATASGHLGPDPVPKKARGPMGDTRPLAIVLPNGEALWFTTRDIDGDTPRLVIPWSLFQYLAMSKRPLSGFQSWGKVGVLYIRRVAQDILHGAQQRGSIMDRIREANRSNPPLLDLNSAYPEPHDATPPTSACTGAHRPSFNFRDFLQRPRLGEHFGPGEGPPRAGRGALPCVYNQPSHEMPLAASIGEADHASNCMGLWAQRLLGQENPSPPAKGAPPKATSEATPSPSTPPPTAPTAEPAPEEVDDDDDSDVELTAEERAEVARIEEECSALERRMRDLSVTQQRSLLENLANASSAVIGGLLADTVRRTAQMRSKGAKGGGRPKVKANQASANKDPKYLEDLSRGLSHAEAFVRHRSRLRAIQHQMEYGDVSLQPRATQVQTDRPLPPLLSLGKAHRLSLLGRLHRLEQQGVTWTQEDVDRCLTMERFLDYLENRESHRPGEPSDAPGTASKSAGAPPPWDPTETVPEGEQSTSTRPNPDPSDPRTTTTGPDLDETLGNPSSTAQASGEPPSEAPHGIPSSTGPSSTSPSTTTAAGRPVEHAEGYDPPGDQPSASTATSEPAESREGEAPGTGAPLPPTNAARHAEAGRFFL